MIHPIPRHNAWAPASWFFPTLIIQQGVNRAFLASSEGDNVADASVTKIRLVRLVRRSSDEMSAEIQKLSVTDLVLDSQSLLPISLSFTTHPDTEPSVDIPVRIEFSDYRTVSGRKVPFRITKFLYGEPFLELTINSARFDAAMPDSEFNAQ